MNDDIFDRIKAFVYDQGFGYTLPFPLSFKKKELTRETTIEGDLKITGDDSDEFLMAFSKEFGVDVSKFKIGDYFGDEGDTILPEIVRTIAGKRERQKRELTLNHLEKAVIAGRLDEEIINA